MLEIKVRNPVGQATVGFVVGSAVTELFELARRDGLDVRKIDVSSIRVEIEDSPRSVVATCQIDYPEDQRYACGCNGRPHWGPGECYA